MALQSHQEEGIEPQTDDVLGGGALRTKGATKPCGGSNPEGRKAKEPSSPYRQAHEGSRHTEMGKTPRGNEKAKKEAP